MSRLVLEWDEELNEARIPQEWRARLEQLLTIAGEQEDIEVGEVALSFVDDEAIRILNRDYRGIDESTDVLSFPMNDEGEDGFSIQYDGLMELHYDTHDEQNSVDGEVEELEEEEAVELPNPLGDIIISVDRAQAQSEEYGHSLEREVGFLFVHGFLHLIGYDHQSEEEEKEMFAKQEQILQKAGLIR